MHHVHRHSFDAPRGENSLDPRLKLLSALALLVMVISCHGIAFPLLISFLCLVLCIRLGVSMRTFLLRFSEPAFIATTVVLLKMFFAGQIPFFALHIAGFDLIGHRDGLMEGLHIASRIAGSVSILAVVGFSTPFTELMAALSWFRVPHVLIEVALFAWRYLFLLMEEAQVVYQAQRNRLGYVGYRRGLRSLGTLAGVLVIKAFDNSQNITTAMVQRGYDGNMPMLLHKPFVATQVAVSILFVAAIGVLRVI